MFCGIDLGTSGVKALLLDEGGGVVAEGKASLKENRPRPGWSEQDPADWCDATHEAVNSLPADLRAAVRGIGLSGQMHGATFLGDDDKPLRPAILWNDGRSAAECVQLAIREPRAPEITGNPIVPGFTAPKALWLASEEPDSFARVCKILLPKDYVRLHLTGEYATDMSDASGTSWLDVGARDWSDAMLAATGLDRSHMPRLLEGTDVSGQLRTEIAQEWGMDRVPVVAGGGDNAAGAVGVGVLDEGQALLSLGTSGVVFAAGDRFRPNPSSGVHAFCHALPCKWHQMSVMLSAASCLAWAAKLTGQADVQAFVRLAETATADSSLIFLPYLSGERTPHDNPDARGVLFGLDHGTCPASVAQAVLEGVAFGLAEGFTVLGNGEAIRELTVIGGGAASPYWGQILAATLGRDLVYRQNAEFGPALGAARLAQLGAGKADAAQICVPPDEIGRVSPLPHVQDSLAPKQARFAELYRALEPHFGPNGEM